ncbi:MAG: DNA polymerase III subunit delta [bacterium]|nr:DNA polymerase III subunit delta [bacterium]
MNQAAPNIAPVCALYGDEAFLKQAALTRIVNAALDAEPGSMGPTRIDGETAELADAMDELRTLGLLGGRRLVIVDPADAFITKYRKQLETYCADPADGGTLVLVCRSLPRNTRLHKAIAAAGEVVECSSLRPRDVGPWIVRRSREAYAKTVDAQAATRLRELVGNDLGILDNELGKLSVYIGGRDRIGLDDVEALVGQHREETVFRVTDAMAAGDVRAAMTAWEQVLATDRAAPARAVGGLSYVIRQLLEAKQASQSGRAVNARVGRDAASAAARLRQADVHQLQRQLCDLYELDLACKTGLADVGPAIETFIVKHTLSRHGPAGTAAGAMA